MQASRVAPGVPPCSASSAGHSAARPSVHLTPGDSPCLLLDVCGVQETIFEDESTVADHQLKDNDILFFVLKTSGDNYEDIKIHKYADSDVPEPKKEGEEAGADESKK